MRSRYAAFALGNSEYVRKTLHGDHPDAAISPDAFQSALLASRGLRRYTRLAILDVRVSEPAAEVLFGAGVLEGQRDISFVELSDFRRERGAWRYLSGILMPMSELPRGIEALTLDGFLAIAER
jgi:SEC-C motif-containing protein